MGALYPLLFFGMVAGVVFGVAVLYRRDNHQEPLTDNSSAKLPERDWETRANVIELLLQGNSAKSVANITNIPLSTVYRWWRRHKNDVQNLRNKQLRKERQIEKRMQARKHPT